MPFSRIIKNPCSNESDNKPSEKIFDKILELTAADPSDSAGMLY